MPCVSYLIIFQAKISIGGPIQHRLSSLPIFPSDFTPNHPDHDKRSGMLVENSGYLIIGEENYIEGEAKIDINDEVEEESEDDGDPQVEESEEVEYGEKEQGPKEIEYSLAEERLTKVCEEFLQEIFFENVQDEICGEHEMSMGATLCQDDGELLFEDASINLTLNEDKEYMNNNKHASSENLNVDICKVPDGGELYLKNTSDNEEPTPKKPKLHMKIMRQREHSDSEDEEINRESSSKICEQIMQEMIIDEVVDEIWDEPDITEVGIDVVLDQGERKQLEEDKYVVCGTQAMTELSDVGEHLVGDADIDITLDEDEEYVRSKECSSSDEFDSDIFPTKANKVPKGQELDSDSSDNEELRSYLDNKEIYNDKDRNVDDDGDNILLNESETTEKVNSSKMINDILGRSRYYTPSTGDFYEYFSSKLHSPSTIAEHVNHMCVVRKLQTAKTGLNKLSEIHIVDQGSDWDFHAPITRLFLWR